MMLIIILAAAILYFGGWGEMLIAVLAIGAVFGLRWLIARYRGLPPHRPYRWWQINVALTYRSEINLVFGAIFDLLLVYIIVLFMEAMFNTRFHPTIEVLAVLAIGVAKYLWSTALFTNHVPTFEKGAVTFLERLVPSGPDGSGFPPGYYWLPLGWPFYKLAIKQPTKEITVSFDQMQVWTANSSTRGQGAVNGQIDGNAQFEITDPGLYTAIAQPQVVLKAIVEEAARDVCERLTIEEFIETRNDELASDILVQINRTLSARTRAVGVRLNSINVTRTDNKSEAVKTGWDQINVQRSTAAARAIDAAARVRRIRAYKGTGVDANRAAALDAVVSDKPGATVGDQRYNVDVGEALKSLGSTILTRFGGR